MVGAEQDGTITSKAPSRHLDRPRAAIYRFLKITPVSDVARFAAVPMANVETDRGAVPQTLLAECGYHPHDLGSRPEGAEEDPGIRHRDEAIVHTGVKNNRRRGNVALGPDQGDRRISILEDRGI
jgi:hypothetical protein